jgi:predicted nucleotidyltransferase
MGPKRSFQLSRAQKSKLFSQLKGRLEDRQEVLFAYLYGSSLTGDPFRDIDLAIYADSTKVHKGRVLSYELELSGGLHYELGFPIDIKILNYAPLSFQFRVLKTGKVLKDNLGKRTDYIEEVSSRSFDYIFFKRSFEEELKNIIKDNLGGLSR